MILTVCMGLFGQVQIQLHKGDHIYLLDSPDAHPVHYQVDDKNLQEVSAEYLSLSVGGIPACEIFFDPLDFETITLRKGGDGKLYVKSIADKLNPSVVAINEDRVSQPIYEKGNIMFCPDRYLVIHTPHLARATSFKIHTNNRVFVFVKQQNYTAKQL